MIYSIAVAVKEKNILLLYSTLRQGFATRASHRNRSKSSKFGIIIPLD